MSVQARIRSQDFSKGGYIPDYKYMQDYARLARSGGMPPKTFLEIRCSEIASEAILGQNQSCGSYMAHEVLHPIFGHPCTHMLSQLTLNFHKRRY